MCVQVHLPDPNCTFVFESCLHLDCLCASSCVVKHEGASLYAHYLTRSPQSPLSPSVLYVTTHHHSAFMNI